MPEIDLQTVLKQRPLGLVFDIDGTLSPIAQRSEEAQLYPGIAALLEKARQDAHVAIMTGRAIENGAAIVDIDGLTYIGTHGLEWSEGLPTLHPVVIVPEAQAYTESGKYLLDLVEARIAELPGVYVQRKNFGGSIHYRLSPDPTATRQRIRSILEEPARRVNMKLSDGKYIVEVLVPLAVNKGHALRQFVERLDLQGVVFAGDDRTDLDAVLEIGRLRQEGKAAVSIVVQHPDTLPVMLEHADIIVHEVDGMAQLLREIVDSL